MSSSEVLQFIYSLYDRGINLWCEGENLKLFIPDNKILLDEEREYIRNHKVDIVALLLLNNIISRNSHAKILSTQLKISPLSFSQERMWFINKFENGSNAYNKPLVFELSENTHLSLLQQALNNVLVKHEVLRTFIEEDQEGNGYQRVMDLSDCPLLIKHHIVYDIEHFNVCLAEELSYVFKLDKEYPIRSSFYEEKSRNKRYLVVIVHHIAFDGWSTNNFLNDLREYYHGSTVPALKIQYKDFALWQRMYLSGDRLKEQSIYWKNYFKDYSPLTLLTDKPRLSKIDYSGDELYFDLDLTTSINLRELAKECGVSLYSVLLSGYYLLLRVYSGQDDIVLGTPIANRNENLVEELIGFFVNSLALRIKVNANAFIKDFIKEVGQMVMSAQLHQDFPFEKLVEELRLERDVSRHPLFQVMFGVESFSQHKVIDTKKENIIKPYAGIVEHKVSIFDFSTFFSDDYVGILKGTFNYAVSLYQRETIEGFIKTYQEILQQFSKLVNSSDKKISEIKYISQAEHEKIVYQWNETKYVYPEDKTLQELFEEQVEKTPDSVALVFEDKKLSYRDLNARANELAHYLRAHYGINSGDLIALFLHRNEWLLIAILAVLKAGGVYVPIDPSYPEERIDYILNDTKAKIVLTNKITEKIKDSQILAIEEGFLQQTFNADFRLNPESINNSRDLAYIIYTSGTTGKPKGVMIEHRGVVNLLFCQLEEFGLANPQKSEHCLCYANYVFDAHVWDIYAPLLSGHTLYLLNSELRQDVNLLKEYIINENISIATIPPVLLDPYDLFALKILIVAGDKTDAKVLDAYYANQVKVINAYGPTETTVCASLNHYVQNGAMNIGKPIHNFQCYILSESLAPLPVGAVGELYIGGVGLARGYLNQSQLTAERFLANPFQGGRIYKTGDRVRWLSNGNLEYIGRNDCQVKIHGYRIELGEIEAAINSLEVIKQSVVLLQQSMEVSMLENSEGYLVAYYVAKNPLDHEMLVAYLQNKLPEYMVPSAFIYLKQFPFTVNGKLDLKALPLPKFNACQSYQAPMNQLENKLVEIWSQVLGISVDKIGIQDNFFRLGGNSIKIIKLQSKLISELDMKSMSIVDLFKYSTISSFVKNIFTEEQKTETYHLQDLKQSAETDIAVISFSGAFSGCPDEDALWDLVLSGKDGLTKLTLEECRALGVSEKSLQNKNYIPILGKVDDINKFDAAFWGLSPVEARLMDPQIRKFLEHCWVVLEQAGYIQERKKLHIGVFAGSGYPEYLYEYILKSASAATLNMWQVLQVNGKDVLAMRVSYALGLTGPSLSINTTCSTSLVAVVEACEKLAQGKCDMALAGGVSFSMPHSHGYFFEENMIQSRDGLCRPFDSEASGIIEGAGIGVVLLKRLADAKRDGDHILSVIKGYATNNDGDRKSGFSAPSVIGQAECIINAQKVAGIDSSDVDYVECHGTGTKLGDPIEVAALHDAFTANTGPSTRRETKCILGGIKANIGHADSAAGIAGLIKVCKMLEHKVIPPQMNYYTVNPDLKLGDHFQIVTQAQAWKKDGRARIAGVSSFGIGGTNAHVIVAEYENTISKTEDHSDQEYILPISAKTRQSLQAYCSVLSQFLKKNTHLGLADIAYTLQEKRESFPCRAYVSGQTVNACVVALENRDFVIRESENHFDSTIIFAFPGQGSQYVNMGLDLYKTEIVFRKAIDECIDIVYALQRNDFKQILFAELAQINLEVDGAINQTEYAQLAIFVTSYACAKLLETMDVKAKTYIGHSIGEYVAATLANVMTLKNAIKIVLERGRLMQSMPKGAMLSIKAPLSKVQSFLGDGVEVAAINAPDYIVVSGCVLSIDALSIKLEEAGIAVVKLKTSHAFHSKMMEKAQQAFKEFLLAIPLNSPTQVFISSVSGTWITTEDATSADYWSQQLRQPVQFSLGVQTVIREFNNPIFIEVGCGSALSTFITQHRGAQNRLPHVAQTLHAFNEYAMGKRNSRMQIIGRLWSVGVDVDFMKANTLVNSRHVRLPTYQFDSKPYWIDRVEVLEEIESLESVIASYPILEEEKVSQLEQEVSSLFYEILGVEHFSKYDNFFNLGGNSILATQLISRLNQYYLSNLNMADIFLYKSVNQLAERIFQVRNNYQVIVNLSITKGAKNLFMIHPGSGGCEVYIDLAQQLSGCFSCYGVDSYNLYNENKIFNLKELAEYYLTYMEKIMMDSEQDEYLLLGWSFGGHIALEMASILEKKGIIKIKIYLIDTMILSNNHAVSLLNKVDIESLVAEYVRDANLLGYEKSYIEKVASNLRVESQLVTQNISSVLKHAEVVLFKAMLEDKRFLASGFKEINQYVLGLQYNHVDHFIDEHRIRCIPVHTASHGTILTEINTMIDVLIQARELEYDGK